MVVSLLAARKWHQLQCAAGKDLLNGLWTVFFLHKTASQKSALNYSKEGEKQLADKAVIEAELAEYRADKRLKVDQLQIFLVCEIRRANVNASERARLLVSEKRSKAQLSGSLDDSKKVENSKYQLNEAVANERGSKSTVKSL